MKNFLEQPATSSQEEQPIFKQETGREKRAQAISRYIEQVIGKNESLGEEEEKEIEEYYKKLSLREKADALYGKMMAYVIDKQDEFARKKEADNKGEIFEPTEPDPYLISDIKVLFKEPAVRALFSDTYGEARMDAKKFRLFELGNLWDNIRKEIQQKKEKYKMLERDLHLGIIKGQGKISSVKTRMARLADNLSALEQRKKSLETLQGFPEIAENTDTVANFQYELLKEYKEQLEKGFVWLPSRLKIHQETVSAILNHRWPVLIGEAGTGKSDQADAAAIELTGYPPTEIECESTTGEAQLIEDVAIDPETGGSYKRYGALMQAFTGYDNSQQREPSFKTGRIARFDESGRLGPKAYAIIKKARQKKQGDPFYGHLVLPGVGAIWTSNPVGLRYPDRHAPDPAMRRELAEIIVDYPDMSKENPELYEFALVALLDKNNHIAVAKKELAPAYEKKDIPEDKRKVLDDGSVVIAKDEIIPDMSDSRHGALWRFTGAIKSLQDSFVYGNSETEKYPDSLLRFKEDADGNIEVTADGSGEPLILSTSTVTLGELASWMTGFNERRQKQDAEFHIDTLTEWLNFKINTYLKQADKADKEKIRAIFKYFHFLEGAVPEVRNVKPLTPKEIGYLSPRVPRPVYLEKPPAGDAEPIEKTKTPKEIKNYEKAKQVMLEDGSGVLIQTREFTLENGIFDIKKGELVPLSVKIGKKIRIKNKDFSFAGVIEDEKSKYNGEPIGKLASGEELYRVFSAEDLDSGIFSYEAEELMISVDGIKDEVEIFCQTE